MTSFGVKCRLPVAHLEDGYAVAVLLCNNSREHIGLLLHPSALNMQDSTRERYNVGHFYTFNDGRRPLARLAFLGNDIRALVFKRHPIKAEWRDIYIADRPPPALDDRGLSLSYTLSSVAPAPTFRIPRWLVRRIESLGMYRMNVSLCSMSTENGPLLFSLRAEDPERLEGLLITLGTCMKDTAADRPVHWGKANIRHKGNWREDVEGTHVCAADHIEAWPGLTKMFIDSDRMVRLSFTPCPFAQEATLVLHLELWGRVYEKLQHDRNVRFPPLVGLAARSSDLAIVRSRTLSPNAPPDSNPQNSCSQALPPSTPPAALLTHLAPSSALALGMQISSNSRSLTRYHSLDSRWNS